MSKRRHISNIIHTGVSNANFTGEETLYGTRAVGDFRELSAYKNMIQYCMNSTCESGVTEFTFLLGIKL